MSDSSGATTGDLQGTLPPPLPPEPSGWVLPEEAQAGPAPGWVFVGFWRRFFATLIDSLILFIPILVVLAPIYASFFSGPEFEAFRRPGAFTTDPTTGQLVPDPQLIAAMNALMGRIWVAWLLILAIQATYYVIFWSWRGGTLGQLLLGIQVRSERDGARIGLGRACLRYIGYLISIVILYIGLIWVVIDPRKQGWHDKIAGTVVVRRVR
jgi:uncharacterized RDD family membrane protein YckC